MEIKKEWHFYFRNPNVEMEPHKTDVEQHQQRLK